MTRTERNTYPAALNKDRHSRSGLASPTERDRKHGAGAHNWGAFSQEGEYEAMARRDADEEQEGGADENLADQVAELPGGSKVTGANTGGQSVEAVSPTSSMASFDSSTSAQNNEGSVPKDIKQAPGMGGRRLSNVSDEEMAKARIYREGVRAQGGPANLADIAKTSFGVSSPPNGNGFGTSPTRAKYAA